MKTSKKLSLCSAVMILVFGTVTISIGAGASGPDEGSGGASIKRGAQLYDKWYKLTGTTPEGNHPAYPPTARKNGPDTWRCKECHGWDYIGKDGRYREGSHYTGIVGVFEARNLSPEELKQAVAGTGTDHDFSKLLSPKDIEALVDFLRHGQIDIATVINPDGSAKGNADQGRPLFAANCASCHGEDGRSMDFDEKREGTQGVGYLATDNPQETIHKIRWGHPGSMMPSMVVDGNLETDQIAHLFSYCQTLPR